MADERPEEYISLRLLKSETKAEWLVDYIRANAAELIMTAPEEQLEGAKQYAESYGRERGLMVIYTTRYGEERILYRP